jgi:hypothetical protein
MTRAQARKRLLDGAWLIRTNGRRGAVKWSIDCERVTVDTASTLKAELRLEMVRSFPGMGSSYRIPQSNERKENKSHA